MTPMRLPSMRVKRSSDWVLQLINIVFLLLLFYLVNGTITAQPESQIQLPKSILIAAGTPPADAIYVQANGTVKFRGSPTTPAEVGEVVQQENQRHPEKSMLVQVVADRTLQAKRLIEVMRELRKNGLNDLTLVTVRETAP